MEAETRVEQRRRRVAARLHYHGPSGRTPQRPTAGCSDHRVLTSTSGAARPAHQRSAVAAYLHRRRHPRMGGVGHQRLLQRRADLGLGRGLLAPAGPPSPGVCGRDRTFPAPRRHRRDPTGPGQALCRAGRARPQSGGGAARLPPTRAGRGVGSARRPGGLRGGLPLRDAPGGHALRRGPGHAPARKPDLPQRVRPGWAARVPRSRQRTAQAQSTQRLVSTLGAVQVALPGLPPSSPRFDRVWRRSLPTRPGGW